MSERINFLEKEFGIKDSQVYYVLFKTETNKIEMMVRGQILNFQSNQMVLKSKDGLFIISPRNIIEMFPTIIR